MVRYYNNQRWFICLVNQMDFIPGMISCQSYIKYRVRYDIKYRKLLPNKGFICRTKRSMLFYSSMWLIIGL